MTEERKQTVQATLKDIRDRCMPILVGFGGSIAYGLDGPDSDIDIRGFFLNPPEEWIGLMPEKEKLETDGSDTVLFGLRKGMGLLLNGNPNVVEILGLRPEHVLICTREGRMILDNAPVFLSKKTAFTFGAFAVNLRMQIEKAAAEDRTDRKKLLKEMSHLIRICAMGKDLMESGCVTAYREKEHGLLMDIRAGTYLDGNGAPSKDFYRLADGYRNAFEAAAARTRLPDRPDLEKANRITMEIVRTIL